MGTEIMRSVVIAECAPKSKSVSKLSKSDNKKEKCGRRKIELNKTYWIIKSESWKTGDLFKWACINKSATFTNLSEACNCVWWARGYFGSVTFLLSSPVLCQCVNAISAAENATRHYCFRNPILRVKAEGRNSCKPLPHSLSLGIKGHQGNSNWRKWDNEL